MPQLFVEQMISPQMNTGEHRFCFRVHQRLSVGPFSGQKVVYSFFPITSRYQRGWCHFAQSLVTVPRVMALSVPGMAVVDM